MRDKNEGGSPKAEPVRQTTASPTVSARRGPAATEDEFGEAEGAATLRPVSADMQQFIGRQLRAVFDDVAKQPVPDRFLELMKQLDNKTGLR